MRLLGRFLISPWLLCPLMGLLLLGASLIDHPTLLKLEYPIYDQLLKFRTAPSDDRVVLITIDRYNRSSPENHLDSDRNLTALINKVYQLGGKTIALLDPPSFPENLPTESLLPSADPVADPQQLLLSGLNPLSHYRINFPENWNITPKGVSSDQTLSAGHLIFFPDADGKIRSQALLIPRNNQLNPSLPLQLAILAQGEKLQKLQTIPRELTGNLQTNTLQIPVIGHYRMLLDIHSEHSFFLTYKGSDLLQGSLKQGLLKEKVVLIGPSNSYGDRHLVAGYGSMNTSELAALTTATLLANSAPERPSWAWLLETAVLLYFVLLLTLLVPRLSFRAGLAVLLLFLASWALVVAGALTIFGVWLKIIPTIILCLSGFTLVRWQIGNQERDQRKQENYRITAQRFQEQGLLDLALEKALLLEPKIKSSKAMLYSLGLEFERKRMPHNAISIYQHLLQAGRFRDTKTRLKRLEMPEQTTVPGQDDNATVILNHSGEKPTLGRYRIERELGQGAMGTVYLGIDPKINRQVAVKTLSFLQVDAGGLAQVKERFFREAEAAGNLNHPNIVTIYDVGEEADLAFFAMELLEGKDLSHYCHPKKQLPIVQVVNIIFQVATALDYAHRKGIIHRDIKPANIVLLNEEQIKVTDFGIARIATSSRTETGIILGTPSYMSPEQVAGKKVDGRSDLFSLGVVMYELLSGEKPFQGESMTALMYNISNSNYRPLAEICPKLPAPCYTIVDKLLQKTFTRRFKSAVILQQELLALQKKLDKS
ncbi:MAG: protein kinase [Thermodesulfobacteriota bacterium]|nr:protein kinase [Thermodesulfobacteriota bacterium]